MTTPLRSCWYKGLFELDPDHPERKPKAMIFQKMAQANLPFLNVAVYAPDPSFWKDSTYGTRGLAHFFSDAPAPPEEVPYANEPLTYIPPTTALDKYQWRHDGLLGIYRQFLPQEYLSRWSQAEMYVSFSHHGFYADKEFIPCVPRVWVVPEVVGKVTSFCDQNFKAGNLPPITRPLQKASSRHHVSEFCKGLITSNL